MTTSKHAGLSDVSDTIVALATGVGRAGVAVIRVSGHGVRFGLETIAGHIPEPRRASLRMLRHPVTGESLDEALVLFFAAPASFTGEDIAELHVHGGRAVIASVIQALCSLPGFRPAQPGEFSRRAVANGCMDLTTAEGIAALVDAQTDYQRRQALRQAGGALERAAQHWRSGLVRLLALMEAEIDFPDEGDVPALFSMVRQDAAVLLHEIERALAAARRGERLQNGARVVIGGPPNAGKSTLLNLLAGRDVAIVSPIAGTTRDAIEVHLDLGGYPVTLVDTAGLRATAHIVEAIGVDRARANLADADLVLWLQSVDACAPVPDSSAPLLRIMTKNDIAGPDALHDSDISLSAQTGDGIDRLLETLETHIAGMFDGAEDALITRARHRHELETVVGYLRSVSNADKTVPVEFVAEDLRLAVRAIGRLTGQVDVDEIYDMIFKEFCIGK